MATSTDLEGARRVLRVVLLAPLFVGSLASCRSATNPDDAEPVQLELLSGDQQPAFAGAELTQPLAVRVTRAGKPERDLAVRWRIPQGGGAVSEPMSRTDTAGVAVTRVTMPIDGAQTLVLAEVEHAAVTFRFHPTLGWMSVGAGYGHTCALSTTGQAYCWGRNSRGQVGDGSETERPTPVRVSWGLEFTALAVGWFHSCGLRPGGEAYCWGDNGRGQLGVGDVALRQTPARVATQERFQAIAAGYLHTCGVTLTGSLLCWGANDHQALGQPGLATRCPNSPDVCALVPTRVETATTFARVAAGEFHTCAVAADGAGHCWGFNGDGELGTGGGLGTSPALPQAVAGGLRFAAIAAHSRHSCALGTDRTAWCWGRNATGETGQDRHFRTLAPQRVGSASFASISTGNTYSCGVLVTAVAACWGSQSGGEGDFKIPTPIPGLTDVSGVSVGFAHACAVAASQVWCWGDNGSHQLGVPSPPDSPTPLRVVFPP